MRPRPLSRSRSATLLAESSNPGPENREPDGGSDREAEQLTGRGRLPEYARQPQPADESSSDTQTQEDTEDQMSTGPSGCIQSEWY
ncbi:MAG: hypothetical protein V5A27_08775 [Halapricum sp.]